MLDVSTEGLLPETSFVQKGHSSQKAFKAHSSHMPWTATLHDAFKYSSYDPKCIMKQTVSYFPFGHKRWSHGPHVSSCSVTVTDVMTLEMLHSKQFPRYLY